MAKKDTPLTASDLGSDQADNKQAAPTKDNTDANAADKLRQAELVAL